jgi:cell division septation protein DedD
MSPEHDDHDREARRDWGPAELPIGSESAAQRLSKRVKPGRRGRIDPTILGAIVLVVLVGGMCAYGTLGPGDETPIAQEEIQPAPLSPEEAVQQGLAANAASPASEPAVSAAPLGQGLAEGAPAAPAAPEEAAQAGPADAPLGAPAPAAGASALEEEIAATPEMGAPVTKPQEVALARPAGAIAAKPAAGAFRVQLLAMSSEQAAQRAWQDLARSHSDLLGKLSPSVERAQVAKGTVYRVQAGPLTDRASADRLCGALAKRGTGCIVVAN